MVFCWPSPVTLYRVPKRAILLILILGSVASHYQGMPCSSLLPSICELPNPQWQEDKNINESFYQNLTWMPQKPVCQPSGPYCVAPWLVMATWHEAMMYCAQTYNGSLAWYDDEAGLTEMAMRSLLAPRRYLRHYQFWTAGKGDGWTVSNAGSLSWSWALDQTPFGHRIPFAQKRLVQKYPQMSSWELRNGCLFVEHVGGPLNKDMKEVGLVADRCSNWRASICMWKRP